MKKKLLQTHTRTHTKTTRDRGAQYATQPERMRPIRIAQKVIMILINYIFFYSPRPPLPSFHSPPETTPHHIPSVPVSVCLWISFVRSRCKYKFNSVVAWTSNQTTIGASERSALARFVDTPCTSELIDHRLCALINVSRPMPIIII